MPQQTLNSDETVVAESSDGTRLVIYRDVSEVDVGDREGEITLDLRELAHEDAAIRFVHEEPEESTSTRDVEYRFVNARLAFGLWIRCGPFNQPEGSAVPREVATDGQEAITAFIHLNNGIPLKREATARICGVTEQTVSDRLTRVRWRPPERDELEEDSGGGI